jgi:hypothetical protein
MTAKLSSKDQVGLPKQARLPLSARCGSRFYGTKAEGNAEKGKQIVPQTTANGEKFKRAQFLDGMPELAQLSRI